MPDLQKLKQDKERIISIIQSRGPSFPTRISRETGIAPLFASAILAELVSEKRLKLSNMKIGSSPLYFTIGQESQLENFAEHLNSKEREAFNLLKENQILQDNKQQPAIRVALREIKDFAHPLNVRLGDETKLFWRFFLFPNDQIKTKIQQLLTQSPKPRSISNKSHTKLTKEPDSIVKTQKPKKQQTSEFANSIKEYITAKDIEILSEISSKKKEFVSKVRIDTSLGKQEYYLTAKDKKKITTNDLTIAIQHAQSNKMPAFFMSPGELDKRAQEYLKEWRNLIKFERIKI